jgi:hypothetical protein
MEFEHNISDHKKGGVNVRTRPRPYKIIKNEPKYKSDPDYEIIDSLIKQGKINEARTHTALREFENEIKSR